MKRPAVIVSVADVVPVTWQPSIEAFGTVYASQGTDVAVELGGVVKAIMFKANDRVTSGQVLVQIDDAVERADLLGDQSNLTTAKEALDRAQSLQKRGVGTSVTAEIAQAAYNRAQSDLAKLQATLEQKAIKAPFTGIIGIPRINLGQYVQPATVVATLQDLDKMKVDFTVPEQALGSLRIGQPAHFGLTPDKMTFSGAVTGIDPKIDPQTRLVSLQALIDNPNDELRPGQFIRIRVELPEEKNVIAVSQTAVTTSLYGDYVFVVDEAKPDATAAPPSSSGAAGPAGPGLVVRQVFVKIGRRNGATIEILSGLKSGERIVTAGQNRLSNGAAVKIDNTVDPTKPSALPNAGA
jgi:membrane fusion protein (multidrug efflux system)